MNKSYKKRAFTLSELIIVISITLIIIFPLFSLFGLTFKTFSIVESTATETRESRLFSNVMHNNVRYAKEIKVEASLPLVLADGWSYVYVDNDGYLKLSKWSNETSSRNMFDIGAKESFNNSEKMKNFSFKFDELDPEFLTWTIKNNTDFEIDSGIELYNTKFDTGSSVIKEGKCVSYTDFDTSSWNTAP